jgi:hypothetical protein
MKNNITASQFFELWVRKGIDPDGESMDVFVSGGEEDSYNSWVEKEKTMYKWVSEADGCDKCKGMDGRVFSEQVNTEDLTHPNCKCDLVEISQEEAQKLIAEHEEELKQRDAAVDALNTNAYPESHGRCAKYVANSLRESGMSIQPPRERYLNEGPSAADYGGSYEKIGFEPINSGQGSLPRNYTAQKGDLVVLQPSEGTSKHGHTAMYNGQYWVSDFKQNTPGGIKRGGNGFFPSDNYLDSDYVIYRNPGWLDW